MTPPKTELTLALDMVVDDDGRCDVGCACPTCEPDQEVRDDDEADYRDRSREAWQSRGW